MVTIDALKVLWPFIALTATHQWMLFITASMDDHDEEKRTEQNLIVHSGKAEAEVTNNRRMCSTYCTIEAIPTDRKHRAASLRQIATCILPWKWLHVPGHSRYRYCFLSAVFITLFVTIFVGKTVKPSSWNLHNRRTVFLLNSPGVSTLQSRV